MHVKVFAGAKCPTAVFGMSGRRPEKPGGAAWNEAAFAKADADKSTTVTAIELAGFLSGSVKSGD